MKIMLIGRERKLLFCAPDKHHAVERPVSPPSKSEISVCYLYNNESVPIKNDDEIKYFIRYMIFREKNDTNRVK